MPIERSIHNLYRGYCSDNKILSDSMRRYFNFIDKNRFGKSDSKIDSPFQYYISHWTEYEEHI